MNNNFKTVGDDTDDDTDFSSGARLGFSIKSQKLSTFSVYIDEEIREPSYYARVFDMLLSAGEHDIVNIFINSPGGRVDGMRTLREGIAITDAHTRAIIIGDAHSSSSMIALSCDELIVTDSAEMLCHTCRYGIGGKSADIQSHVVHSTKVWNKLTQEVYRGFLTEAELEAMLNGKEFYFDAEEIRERALKRAAYLEKLEAQEPVSIPEAVEVLQDAADKPVRKKKGT